MNCIENLKFARGGFVLADMPATASAASEIEATFVALENETSTMLATINARRQRQEIGVDCAGAEARDWYHWQAIALRRFHEVRGEAAGRCLLLCDDALKAEAEDLRQREDAIKAGLGKLLGDARAGADLGALLLRFLGSLPTDGTIRAARNGWHRLTRESARALIELPKLPNPPPPTNTEQTDVLNTMIRKEG